MKSFILLLLLVTTSCSPLISKRELYVADYQAGNFESADIRMSTLLYETSKNEHAWLKLDRGLERLVAGHSQQALGDFNEALDTLDYYNEAGLIETFGQGLFCDAASPYRGDDFEQVLARVYFALALLQEGDESNAFAILRQAEEWIQSKQEFYKKSPSTACFAGINNPVSKILFASLLEKQNDASNAKLLYEQAGFDFSGPGPAVIMVICHNGTIPYKISKIASGSQASLLALELLAVPPEQRAFCNMAGVPVPKLHSRINGQGSEVKASIDGIYTPLQTIYNLENAALSELNQKEPLVIARGVGRLAARRMAALAANRHDPNVGAWVDLGMLVANLATLADTRSWSLLPRQIEMARFDVQPGCHTATFNSAPMGPSCLAGTFTARLNLKKGDLCVINIFNIHPGVTRVLIPQRFQETP